MSDKFGVIPLQDQVLPLTDNRNVHTAEALEGHKVVHGSGTFNFLKSQQQVPSQLKADLWKEYLHEYWDKQLQYLIRYGFPLDFDSSIQLSRKLGYHGSGDKYPQDIEAYLSEEKEHNAILGTFHTPPITDLHVSPLLTGEKPGAPHRRVIIDLSFPAGQ